MSTFRSLARRAPVFVAIRTGGCLLFRGFILILAGAAAWGEPITVGGTVAVSPGIHGAVELVFPSEVGKYYQIQISADLAAWDNEGYSLKGTGGEISALARTRGLAAAYYRLRDDGDPANVTPTGPPGEPGPRGETGEGLQEGLSVQGAGDLLNAQTFTARRLADWRTGTPGGSPPLRGLLFGDSLATGFAPGPTMSRSGVIGLGYYNVAGPVTFHGSDSPQRFDYWINGKAAEFGVGASAEMVEGSQAGGDLRGTEAMIACIARPDGGSFDLQYQRNRAGVWTTLATVDTAAVDVQGLVRRFPLPSSLSPFNRLRIANVTDGACLVLFGGIYATDGGGVIWMPVGALGGIDVAQSATTPASILNPVWAALAPDFVITCWADAASEWEPDGAFRRFHSSVTTVFPATDWILVSANPALDETGRPEQRAAQKLWAEESGQTWINGHAMFRDYATAFARGLMIDAVHLNAAGQAARNLHLWAALPLGRISLGGAMANGFGEPVMRSLPGGLVQGAPIEITSPVQIRSGNGYLSFYDRTSPLEAERQWKIQNEGVELKFSQGGSNAVVLGFSTNIGIHPGGDGFKLGRQDARWRGWFSGVQKAISTVTSDYTPTANDHTVLCDASVAAFRVSLPPASVADHGRIYVFKKVDSSPHRVTLDPHDTQTIDGQSTTIVDKRRPRVEIQSNGSAWFVIGN